MKTSAPHILVVDDEPNIRKMLSGLLEDEGYEVTAARDAEEARANVEAGDVDLMLLDVLLPGIDGLELLKNLRDAQCCPPVIMMSGHGSIQTAVEATRLGALDFIEKPIQVERLLLSLENCLCMDRLRAENAVLRQALPSMDEIIGSSKAMTRMREEIARAAPTDARVLITGENGTGKELVARALHAASKRCSRPFIKVNCAAIPSELLESELFGHERGAFTGAVATRRGKFELAQRGTLLLDEIGDMNPTTQAKLLRVLEECEMERVGGERTISLDVRIFASTNRDIELLLRGGAFRKDLYHRLKVVPIHVAPLREHTEDLEQLAVHYLRHFCAANGRRPKRLTDEAITALVLYRWPGNVRELKNLMERIVIMVDGLEVGSGHVRSLIGQEVDGGTVETESILRGRSEDSFEEEGSEGGHAEPSQAEREERSARERQEAATLAQRLDAYECQLIKQALEEVSGNVAAAARNLGLDRANLHRKIRRLGLHRP
ncbi:MAG: sigma-54-dependent Fis family transcriptional regulator [Candidatus Eisenbacteria sp.]|nr:sigma-54-dependent Fis family transcriptional regulator [Candidatus Eisenbacteria bacterium]